MIQLDWTCLLDLDTGITLFNTVHKYALEWVLECWVRIVFPSESSIYIEEQICSMKVVVPKIEVAIYITTRGPVKAECSVEVSFWTSLVQDRSAWSDSILEPICIHVKISDYVLVLVLGLFLVPTAADWTEPLFVPIRVFVWDHICGAEIVCNGQRLDGNGHQSCWPGTEDCWVSQSHESPRARQVYIVRIEAVVLE